jgi:hypothetical protein
VNCFNVIYQIISLVPLCLQDIDCSVMDVFVTAVCPCLLVSTYTEIICPCTTRQAQYKKYSPDALTPPSGSCFYSHSLVTGINARCCVWWVGCCMCCNCCVSWFVTVVCAGICCRIPWCCRATRCQCGVNTWHAGAPCSSPLKSDSFSSAAPPSAHPGTADSVVRAFTYLTTIQHQS